MRFLHRCAGVLRSLIIALLGAESAVCLTFRAPWSLLSQPSSPPGIFPRTVETAAVSWRAATLRDICLPHAV